MLAFPTIRFQRASQETEPQGLGIAPQRPVRPRMRASGAPAKTESIARKLRFWNAHRCAELPALRPSTQTRSRPAEVGQASSVMASAECFELGAKCLLKVEARRGQR